MKCWTSESGTCCRGIAPKWQSQALNYGCSEYIYTIKTRRGYIFVWHRPLSQQGRSLRSKAICIYLYLRDPSSSSTSSPVTSDYCIVVVAMASYRGSALQSSRIMPAAAGTKHRSRAFCGNNIGIYRAPPSPMKIRDDREGKAAAVAMATHRRTRISASASEPPPPMEMELAPATTSWVDRWVPVAAKPYALLARLDRLDATWLYLWPCLWYVTYGTPDRSPVLYIYDSFNRLFIVLQA